MHVEFQGFFWGGRSGNDLWVVRLVMVSPGKFGLSLPNNLEILQTNNWDTTPEPGLQDSDKWIEIDPHTKYKIALHLQTNPP